MIEGEKSWEWSVLIIIELNLLDAKGSQSPQAGSVPPSTTSPVTPSAGNHVTTLGTSPTGGSSLSSSMLASQTGLSSSLLLTSTPTSSHSLHSHHRHHQQGNHPLNLATPESSPGSTTALQGMASPPQSSINTNVQNVFPTPSPPNNRVKLDEHRHHGHHDVNNINAVSVGAN